MTIHYHDNSSTCRIINHNAWLSNWALSVTILRFCQLAVAANDKKVLKTGALLHGRHPKSTDMRSMGDLQDPKMEVR